VYEVRLSLETLAMRRAAAAFTDAHAAYARRCLIELENTSDDASVTASEAHARFHFAFYEAAQSAWLERLIRPTWQVSERYALEWPQVRRLQDRADEHREILAACEARDPDRAAAALHQHLAITANSLAEAMGGEPLYPLGAADPDHVREDRRWDAEHAGAQQF
jgi:DNA-binding GntR family transcriptional regulator